jgi:hypothetical protein
MEQETTFAKQRREAHVIVRALDAVMWADERDKEASSRIVNRLWRRGLLNGVILPEQILEYMSKSHRKQYERLIEQAA